MHTLPQNPPWYCSPKSLLLESDKDRLQKGLSPEFPGTRGWNHNLKSSQHLSLLLTPAIPAEKLKPEFSGVANSSHCQTKIPFLPQVLSIRQQWKQTLRRQILCQSHPADSNCITSPTNGGFQVSSWFPVNFHWIPYSGSHSSGDSCTFGVSFLIYHPAMSEILSHQRQQQPPWVSRALTPKETQK